MTRHVDKIFLDANILFSAAYTPDSGLLRLWSAKSVRLFTSQFALEEARRNLAIHNPGALATLDELASNVTTVPAAASASLPQGIHLPDKDAPLLAAAVQSGCSHFLTGDKRHFGELYGQAVAGVLVLTPAQYLQARKPPET